MFAHQLEQAVRGEKGVAEIHVRVHAARADVGIRRQMPGRGEWRGAGLLGDDFAGRDRIIDVRLEELEARVFERGRQVLAPAQFQVVNAGDHRAAREQRVHEMAADESCGTGDQTV